MSKNGGKGGKESRNSKEVSVSRGLDKNLETPLLLRIETKKSLILLTPIFLMELMFVGQSIGNGR